MVNSVTRDAARMAEALPLIERAGFREVAPGQYRLDLPNCPPILYFPRTMKWTFRGRAQHGKAIDLARVIASLLLDPPKPKKRDLSS